MGNKAAAKLRAQLADTSKIIVCPGVQDGLSARVCLQQGFETLYMTGAGTAASVLGMPDLGLTTADDMVRNAGMIASLDRNVPLIADADTGFGGPVMVARTVERYIHAGVAGMHIEDQVTTKRCGHLQGKELVDIDTYVSRIRAAAAARKRLDDDIVLIARTDALQGFGFDEAVRRLKAAVAVGADVAFLEGVKTKQDMGRIVEVMSPTPCLINMVPGGVTPLISSDEAHRLGYRIAIWPCFAMTAAYLAYHQAARELKTTGAISEKQLQTTEEDSEEVRKRGPVLTGNVRDIFDVCGLSECVEFDKEVGGKAFTGGI